jgi:hypothetical protein
MKALILGALVSAQIAVSAQPALAADLGDERGALSTRQGAFAGARIRVPLDGGGTRRTQASLAVAPIVQGRQADGRVVTRFGEGMELRLNGAAGPELALAGRPLSQIAQGRTGPDGRKSGISTIGWVAIGVGVAAITVLALGQLCIDGEICGDDDDG